MSSPDDKFPDNNSSNTDDPSIDDPNWAASIVERAVRKAESEKSSASTKSTSPQQSSAPDLRSPTQPAPALQPTRQAHATRAGSAGATAVVEHEATEIEEDTTTTVEDTVSSEPARRTTSEPVEDEHPGVRIRQLVEWIVVIVGALVVALAIKAFLIQPFYIPSGSMSPTLNEDDRILVNKLSYDLHNVNRGDIVVFDTPENFPNRDIDNLVKRVVALEGETIDFSDGRIVIDDRLLDEPYIADELPSTWTAGLPPGCIGESADTGEGCTIPDGHVFVMGDNRTGSDDSRVFGPIPEDLIVGRAFLRVWPLGEIGFL